MRSKIPFWTSLVLGAVLLAFGLLLLWGLARGPVAPKTEAWHAQVHDSLPLSPRTPIILERLGKLAQGLDADFGPPYSQPGDIIFEQKAPEGLPVAIIIDDMGLSLRSRNRIKGLPPEVTLSFLPYAPDLQAQIQDARAEGHEIMIHFPMEPMGKADPGPDALLTSLSSEELEARIQRTVHAFGAFDGINNHMGSRFTSRADLMKLFFNTLKNIDIKEPYFVDSYTIASSVAEREARKAGFRTGRRNIFLDDKIEKEAILKELERVGNIAHRKGSAIVIGHPHLLTTQLLKEWIPTMEAKGLRLVPVSVLVQ